MPKSRNDDRYIVENKRVRFEFLNTMTKDVNRRLFVSERWYFLGL